MPKKVNLKNETLSTNKVYEVILSMNKADRRRCLKFLESPFFSSSETLLSLYLVFVRIAEVNGVRGFSKEGVWFELFKNSNYVDINFRKYCSDLFRLIEGFLSVPLEEDVKFYNSLHIVENVREKKIEPLYNKVFDEFERFLSEQPYRNSKYYYFSFKKASLQYEVQEKNKLYRSKVNYEEISASLDAFYFIEKLKILCHVLSHKRLINVEYRINFSEEIDDFVKKFDLLENPSLSLFYHIYRVLANRDDEQAFFELKKLQKTYWQIFPKHEMTDVVISAMNFCTDKINKGRREFYNEYFELVQFGLEKEFFILDGFFEVWLFNNFVYVALQIGEIDWAVEFIALNKKYLSEDQRESTVSFNLARVYRKKGEIRKVLEVLKNVEYADLSYNMNSKAMLAMAYFDLDEYDSLDSLVDSFKVYLTRHKDISTQKRKLYLNFIKYTRRLMKLIPSDQKAIEKFREDLQKEKTTTVNHDWLLEKLEQLK